MDLRRQARHFHVALDLLLAAGQRAVDTRFGRDYARTLAEWRRRFLAEWPAIEAQGFDLPFQRLWTYYLSYCEAGFLAGRVDVGLYRLTRGT